VYEILRKASEEDPPAPSGLRPEIDAALEAVVLRAMARRPEGRYQTAKDPEARTTDVPRLDPAREWQPRLLRRLGVACWAPGQGRAGGGGPVVRLLSGGHSVAV